MPISEIPSDVKLTILTWITTATLDFGDMATLSSSPGPATVMNQSISLGDLTSSPIPTFPVPKTEVTATMVAFRNARDTYRKSLSEKDVKAIMIPTGPEDVVNEIEKWQKRHVDSTVAAGVRAGLVRLQKFSASIDMLAQGAPNPACLLWGSIKFVLTVSSQLILYKSRSMSFHCEHQNFEPMDSAAIIANQPSDF